MRLRAGVGGRREGIDRRGSWDRHADWALDQSHLPAGGIMASAPMHSSSRAAPSSPIPGNAFAHDQLGSLLSWENDLPGGRMAAPGVAGPMRDRSQTSGSNLMPRGRTSESEAAFAEADRLGAPPRRCGFSRTHPFREVQGDFAARATPRSRGGPPLPPRRSICCAWNTSPGTGRDQRRSRCIKAARDINGKGQLEQGGNSTNTHRSPCRGLGRLRRRQSQARGLA